MADHDLEDLLSRIEAEARKGDFSIDTPIYAAARRDPMVPILFAGDLHARLGVMGRDLGREEVRLGQPLIGDAGRRVREAIYESVTGRTAAPSDRELPVAMEHVVLTNTVPYKPEGNKAYPTRVKERFRPFLEEFLCFHWQGDYMITLGTEAFRWYAPYADQGASDLYWEQEDRYSAEFHCNLRATVHAVTTSKSITVAPLPHPSPLNQTYWPVFPDMLRRRLRGVLGSR